MQTLTLANIYELQGLKVEALNIYKGVLENDPDNSDAKIAIKRLSGVRKEFAGVDEQMRDFFLKMESQIELNEFERWLLGGNRWN